MKKSLSQKQKPRLGSINEITAQLSKTKVASAGSLKSLTGSIRQHIHRRNTAPATVNKSTKTYSSARSNRFIYGDDGPPSGPTQAELNRRWDRECAESHGRF